MGPNLPTLCTIWHVKRKALSWAPSFLQIQASFVYTQTVGTIFEKTKQLPFLMPPILGLPLNAGSPGGWKWILPHSVALAPVDKHGLHHGFWFSSSFTASVAKDPVGQQQSCVDWTPWRSTDREMQTCRMQLTCRTGSELHLGSLSRMVLTKSFIIRMRAQLSYLDSSSFHNAIVN